jgi:hypothetical protein
MLRAIGVIVVIVLAATVLGMIGARLSPTAARAIPFLMPLVGLGAVAFFLSGNKNARADPP